MIDLRYNLGGAGDNMTYFLRKHTNALIVGNTTTWGSGQGMGGISFLTDEEFAFTYPVILTPDTENLPAVDPKADRKTRIPLDVWITYDREGVIALFSEEAKEKDLLLEQALEIFDTYQK